MEKLFDDVPSCGLRATLRILWAATEFLSNLFFILNINEISDGKYNPRLVRDADILSVLYILIFIGKSIYWLYSFYHVIYNNGFLSVKSRVLALWFLSISSGALAIIILNLPTIQSNPFYFIIIIFHIGIICKQCFVLGSFPFNIFFQYVLSLLFATNFILILPAADFFPEESSPPIEYMRRLIFIMCALFLILITFRPISVLCEGKYPKFVKPVYRDYYNSEDGGWRNDQIEPVEETAISAYKTQLFSVPDSSKKKQIEHDIYQSSEDGGEETEDHTDMAHSLINMVSHDIILPTSEPSQFDKCFYWNLSLLFIFFIHIPIIILMSLKTFDFLQLIPDANSNIRYDSELQIGVVIYIFFVLPTSYILGIVLLLLIFRMFDIGQRCTHILFWCIFNKQYFDIIAIHRGHNEKNKEEYYSSLWSFKKRRKKSSNAMLDEIIETNVIETNSTSLSNVPKAPPTIDNLHISSLRDSFILKQNESENENYYKKKKNKKKKKKNRNESINSDQELQKWSEEHNNNSNETTELLNKQRKNSKKELNNDDVMPLSLGNESMAYVIKDISSSSVDKTIDNQ